MCEWKKSLGAITLFVKDLERSKSFYRETFDLPITFEDSDSAVFSFENTLVNLLVETAAVDLITPAPVADQTAGSRMQFTIWVEDADAVCADLASRGVTLLSGPIDRAWGHRTASFSDPDGHIWEIAQSIPRA
jgi:lactoylglutathione lyase